jgi:hypothetical protein
MITLEPMKRVKTSSLALVAGVAGRAGPACDGQGGGPTGRADRARALREAAWRRPRQGIDIHRRTAPTDGSGDSAGSKTARPHNLAGRLIAAIVAKGVVR